MILADGGVVVRPCRDLGLVEAHLFLRRFLPVRGPDSCREVRAMVHRHGTDGRGKGDGKTVDDLCGVHRAWGHDAVLSVLR